LQIFRIPHFTPGLDPISRRIPPPSPAKKVWRRRQPNFGRRSGAPAEIYVRRRRIFLGAPRR